MIMCFFFLKKNELNLYKYCLEYLLFWFVNCKKVNELKFNKNNVYNINGVFFKYLWYISRLIIGFNLFCVYF